MIVFDTGKPGDGKTLYAVGMLIRDLLETEVFIVTNIPLNFATLRAYLVKQKADVVIDLDARLKIIPDDEVYEFYRHRSGALVLPWSPDKEAGEDGTKRLPRPEFIAAMKAGFAQLKQDKGYQLPVHYYIDEAHNFFSAREWATNGRGLLYYASQHRHLHDNVFLITQVLDNVEKQLRGLASETHMVRNQLRRRIGPVKMRPVFRVKSFYGVPVGNVRPFAETTFSLDAAGVASCYRTVGALGVQTAPEKIRNKGLPWWLLPIGGAAAVLAIVFGLVSLPALGGMWGRHSVRGTLAGMGATPGDVVPTIRGTVPQPQPKEEKPAEQQRTEEKPAATVPLVKVRGYVVRGGLVQVVLTDGRVLDETSKELQRINRRSVVIDGQVVQFVEPGSQVSRVSDLETTRNLASRDPSTR